MGKADAPPAGESEEEELEELQGMIGGVPRGMFVKLQIAQQNRNAADDVRREKAELMALRARRAQEQDERIERLRLKRESSQTAAAEFGNATSKSEASVHPQTLVLITTSEGTFRAASTLARRRPPAIHPQNRETTTLLSVGAIPTYSNAYA